MKNELAELKRVLGLPISDRAARIYSELWCSSLIFDFAKPTVALHPDDPVIAEMVDAGLAQINSDTVDGDKVIAKNIALL